MNEETTASSSPDEPARRVGRIAQGATLLVRELLATEDADVLFVVRSDDAQVLFYPDFDQIVLLRAPRDVMLERFAFRTNNPFGKSSEELARILADLETFEAADAARCNPRDRHQRAHRPCHRADPRPGPAAAASLKGP